MRRFTFIHRGEGEPESVSIEILTNRCAFRRGETADRADVVRLPDGRLSLIFDDGRQICGRVLPSREGEVEVVTGGARRRIALAEPLRDRLAHGVDAGSGPGQDEEVRALMPGRVVEIVVAAGDRVAPGALLLVLEAMKMQNEIRTAQGGTVLRVEAEPGKPVEGGALLAIVRAEEAGSERAPLAPS